MIHPIAIDKRYTLQEKLGEGGMGAVYRATDRLTGQTVALKSVLTTTNELLFSSKPDDSTNLKVALAREFQTLASLRHPHIISVLDYGFDSQRQPFFTMEFIEGSQSIFAAGLNKSQEDRLRLVEQLVQALVYLHRRGVLHRDLKPANVLVVDGQVKVLDFGLSVTPKTDNLEYATQTSAGTFAYMAPEVFEGNPISPAADLYAVGVIMYELLAGRHPFSVKNLALLVNEILNKPADVASLGLDFRLALILQNLLEKSRELRYSDAEKLLHDLHDYSGKPLSADLIAIRESFLQAAKFVGREAELSSLTSALHDATQGNSSLWLVGGESGVGKSRLLDELRIHAVVKGTIVLKGQAISEGSAPYQLWREPLRLLTAYTDLSDDEAAVLKPVISDIGDLLQRDIPDPAPLDPQGTQSRLFNTITALLKRQQQPYVFILEDWHWAGSESLALLQHLLQNLADVSILIIATYRHDEQPDLPKSFPGARTLLLKRLADTAIEELSISMLGERGHDPAILNLLYHETEGNAFFLVEVMRALAEEAGQLDEISAQTLPKEVFARGVQSILQRRLNHLSEPTRQLLQLAAVIGRQIDLGLLKTLDSTVDVDAWLNLCSDAAVLEVREDRWRFAHDKLRQELLNTLGDEKVILHRQVAEAIEANYPNSTEYAAALANHWNIAGDAMKELQYCVLAGQQAQSNSAMVEVVRYFSRALTLLYLLPESAERDTQEVALQIALGLAVGSSEGYGSANVVKHFSRARELLAFTDNSPQLGPALMGMWVYYFAGAKYAEAIEVSSQFVKLAPKTDYPALLLVGGNTIHAGNYCGLGEYETSLEIAHEAMRHYDPSLDTLLIGFFQHHLGLVATLWAAANLCILGYVDQARKYLDEAPRRIATFNHPQSSAIVLAMSAWILPILGDVEQTKILSDQAIELTSKYGMPFWLGYATVSRGWVEAQQGNPVKGAKQIVKGREIYHSSGAISFDSHFLAMQAEAYQKAGLIAEAQGCIEAALTHVETYQEGFYHAELCRLKGEFSLASGDTGAAEDSFRQAINIAQGQKAKLFELRAAKSLAQIYLLRGDSSAAYQTLSDVYSWFTEGFDTPDLKDAKALLEKAQSEMG